ncbi:MAG TPA: YebC/PmpR family DNA-binding transcriptional regulator, partial [Acidimicrobiales bacterium]|nr:YebC/PmpR family DNA-binding transcriptional regulator [Acidimicrobiales bacterium]
LREALEEAQISFESADVTMLASSTVEVTDPQEVKAVLKLVDLLDEDDDVQDVYANFDIPDDVLENLQL